MLVVGVRRVVYVYILVLTYVGCRTGDIYRICWALAGRLDVLAGQESCNDTRRRARLSMYSTSRPLAVYVIGCLNYHSVTTFANSNPHA